MATSTGAITSTGIGSGLDVSSIMTKLMAVENQPLDRLKEQATSINSKLSTVGKLQSNMSTLRDKVNALVSPTLWSGTKASVSEEGVVKVSTDSSATAGSYAVQVNKLATRQTVASDAFTDASASLGGGALTISLGSYDDAGAFAAKPDNTPVRVAIDGSVSTLADVRDKINASGAGVVASIIKDASGSRLTIRSSETGAEQAFKISVEEDNNDGNVDTGLSALGFDAGDAASPMARTTKAENAEVLLNGVSVSSATNTLSDVIDGLTLSLTKTNTTPVTVDVVKDTEAIKTAITDFVTAFNSTASFIRTQTAYNEESKTAGALQGDQGTLALQSQLRAVLNANSTASSVFSRLSDVGIAIKSDGTLETSATKLDNALGNPAELKKLFVTDGDTNEASGFARRFKRLSDAALGTDGVFDARTSSLRSSATRNEKSQASMENRLALVQARLQQQYTALDTTMSQLSNLSTYMTQQIAALSNS